MEGFEVLESPQTLANEIFFKEPNRSNKKHSQQFLVGMLGFCVFFPQQNVCLFFFRVSVSVDSLPFIESDLFESFIENTFFLMMMMMMMMMTMMTMMFMKMCICHIIYILYTHLQDYDVNPTSDSWSEPQMSCRTSSCHRTTAWRRRRMWQSNCKQRRNWWSATYRCGEDLICPLTHATRHGGWGPPSPPRLLLVLLVLPNLYEKVSIHQRGASTSSFWRRIPTTRTQMSCM